MVHIEIREFVNIKNYTPWKVEIVRLHFIFYIVNIFLSLKRGFLLLLLFLSKTTNILITQDKHEIMPKSCNLIHIIYILRHTIKTALFKCHITHTNPSVPLWGNDACDYHTHSKISFGGFKGWGRICGSICLWLYDN